jgi:hypothetical protein
MKPNLICIVVALALTARTVPVSGQELPPPEGQSVRGTPGVATRQAIVNFGDLARQAALPADPPTKAGLAAPEGFTRASLGGTPASPAPAADFAGLIDDTFQAPPSDTHGAVGPNHRMEVSNYGVHIQDRSGRVISTVILLDFWASVGPFNPFFWKGTNWAIFLTPRFTMTILRSVGFLRRSPPTKGLPYC